MRSLRVDFPASTNARGYDILIQPGLLHEAGTHIRPVTRAERLLLVSDTTVAPLYEQTVRHSLEHAGFTVGSVCIPTGESSKSLTTLETIYDAGLAFHLTRHDALVALGGGVVGDVTGFAAATLLRGIDFIQIPTTLLAQVDSSVGGKVAVNLKAGKNLAGAFHQPKLVLIDPDCLNTLPDPVFADGMGEIIKYGAALSQPLFERLESAPSRAAVSTAIASIIHDCCELKRQLVVEDEHDTGKRMLLNFGHTLGHAYEAAYNYERYSHGAGVAAGMCAICTVGEYLGLTDKAVRPRLASLVRSFGLPEAIACSFDDYTRAIALDKKGFSESITLILLTDIGNGFMHKLSRNALFNMLQRMIAA